MHSWGLCSFLLTESQTALSCSLLIAWDLAKLAVVVSDHLDADLYGNELTEALRSRTRAHLEEVQQVASLHSFPVEERLKEGLSQLDVGFRLLRFYLLYDLASGDSLAQRAKGDPHLGKPKLPCVPS